MPRKARLSEAEVFFIEEKSRGGMSDEEIATKVGKTVSQIEPFLQKPTKKPTRTHGTFGRHPRGGIVVATEASSMDGDAKPSKRGRDTSGYIRRTHDSD